VWDDDAARCVVTEASCDDDDVSIAEDCSSAARECVELGDRSATCGGCMEGFVLRSGECREPVRCDDLYCADQNRDCTEAEGDEDARCDACAEGTLESAGGPCVRQSCAMDADGASLGATCAAQNRACTTVDSGARCGGCYAGYVEIDGACQAVVDCEARGCNENDRLCVVDDEGQARCTSCRAGYREIAGVCSVNPSATCDPAPAAGSVLEACASEHRSCVNDTCGDCEAGYYWDTARGACTESVSCDSCADARRECITENGANRCGGCAPDHIVDRASGECRPVVRCDDIDCAQGDVCVEATASTDALCRTDCGERAIFNGGVCVPCPGCDAQDALGNATELGIEPRATQNGECICQTAPSYFYSLAGEVGAFPCDADGDGWVRQSARVAYDLGDQVLRENARCALRFIDRFALVNERGDRLEVPLEAPLPMFESDRNDDDVLLQVTWDRLGLPTDFDPSYVDAAGAACATSSECADDEVCRNGHCTAVPKLTARSLNALTKYCHSVLTDYNDNGVADVEEWAERPTQRGAERRVLNTFSYFAELHNARWEANGPNADLGAMVITERTRTAGAGATHSALTYDDGAADAHWRSCTVRRDVQWADFGRPIGMDFASYEANPSAYLVDNATPLWRGMAHHSQFKCLVVTSEPDDESPHEVTVADAVDPTRDLNACRLVAVEPASDVNPASPQFACTVQTSAPSAGDVLWASVNYGDYPSAASLDGYVRGCVNGCAEARLRADARLTSVPSWDCPTADYGAQNDGENLACTRNLGDFGRLQCLEACGDGIDNDGDGLTDAADLIYTDPVTLVDLTTGQACNTTLSGICGTGTVGCEARPGGALTCIPTFTPAATDLCDGLDNDCDGDVDDDAADPPSGFTPTTPSGAPRVGDSCNDATQFGICREGALFCRPAGGGVNSLQCETIRPTGETETCNTFDDDCDGDSDEVGDLPAPFGTSCTPMSGGVPRVGVCANGQVRCVGGAQACAQVVAASTESSSVAGFAACDTRDNDCDGTTDEGGSCDGSASYSFNLFPSEPTMGDREFDGNGPRGTVTVSHTLINGGQLQVEACVEFVETQPDTSTGRACGTRIISVTGRNVAMAISQDANLQYVDTDDEAADVLVGGGVTETLVTAQRGDLTSVVCIGDTDGDDIGFGTGCNISGNVRYRVAPIAPSP
jgi:hypothetical protein